MNEFLKQIGSTLGAAFTAACCLGVAAALSALTAIGAGFLINDAFLIPLYVLLLALSLWLLYRSAKAHAGLVPFWVGEALRLCLSGCGSIRFWFTTVSWPSSRAT